MKIYPQLFKRTSNGDIQVWHIEQDGDKYRSVTGKRGGKMVEAAWTTAKPKNVGKKNESTGEEQATSQIESIYTKKLRQDFFKDVNEIDNKTRITPMLAEPFAKVVDKLPDDEVLYFQPKFDGFRCIATIDGLFTRDGLPITAVPHITRALAPLFARNKSLIFDGELYNHDLHDDFNQISSILRKESPTVAQLMRAEEVIEYHIYDIPSLADLLFERRNNALTELLTDTIMRDTANSTPLRLVETVPGLARDAVDMLNRFLGQKYEGAIGRRNAKYEFKRTKSLLKVKKFLDEEFQITDILPGEGNRSNIAARACLQTKDGKPFKAGIIGDHGYCAELLANKRDVIGQMGTVQFLNYTPGGVPRGGKLKTVRWA